MPCVRQYILERIRFDKRKEKKIAESRWNEKSFICFFGSRDNEAKPIL